jgi:MYXO-CTERM domain-containing protein
MSSRSLLLVALVLLAAAPAASAQASQTLTIQIQDLPATATANDTVLAVPFKVHATVSGASPCLGAATSGSSYTIDLAAAVTNSTGGNITRAQVNPKQITIAGPVLLPAAGGNAERTEGVTLLVYPAPYSGAGLNGTIKVTASFAGGSGGCTGATTPAAQDTKDVKVAFLPPQGYGSSTAPGNNAPAPGALLLLAALAAAVLVMRRRSA